MGAGLVTAVPLMIYANGAKGLRLSTIGIMQYIAPSMILVIALTVFGETLGPALMIAFPMIWTALALYTLPMLRKAAVLAAPDPADPAPADPARADPGRAAPSGRES